MPTLAASQLIPPSLPGPGLVELFIFERPELFLVLQLICGSVLLWRINSHGMLKKLWYLPLICVALGLGAMAYGNSVETVREKLMRQTAEFVDAMVGQDAARVGELVDTSLVIERVPQARDFNGLILAMSMREVRDITDYSVNVKGGVRDNENAGRTQASVHATATGEGSTTTPAIFEFAWRRATDGTWKMTRLTMLRMPT